MIPSAKFYLCKTKLFNLSNELTFGSVEAQHSYFSSTVMKSYTDFTYMEKDRVIRVPNVANEVMSANYCMFQNTNFGNKWFYAFVTNIEYVSPKCTNIHINIDPWQTFLFDITIGECFVEREHLSKSDDIIGANTLPENLPLGYLTYHYYTKYSPDIGCIIGAKKDLNGKDLFPIRWGNAMFGNGIWYCSSLDDVNGAVKQLEEAFSGNVLFLQSINNLALKGNFNGGGFIYGLIDPIAVEEIEIAIRNNIDGYIPKNKKLFTYPYNYIGVTSGKGLATYAYERFFTLDGKTCRFQIYAEMCQAPYDMCAPVLYEGNDINYDKACTTDVYPTIPWQGNNTEYYNMAKAFMQSRHMVQDASNLIGGMNSVTNSLGKMDVYGAAENAMNSIINQELTDINQSLQTAELNDKSWRNSITSNGQPTGDMLFNHDLVGFTFFNISVSKEYAQIIDDYFTKFGYSTLRVKKPNINNRPNFNFVKTSNANIYGNCPATYINQIKQAFDNGITLWHSAGTMYDYDSN